MVTSDTNPCVVGSHVVDVTGNRLAGRILGKVVDHGFLGLPLRLPLPANVFEIPYQLLLLRIDKNTGWAR